MNQHLLPGSQHPQNGFIAFLQEILGWVRQFCRQQLVLRADSAHDALAKLLEP